VTRNLSCKINVKIANILVGLTNGIDATTTKDDIVILDGGLQLDNVLFCASIKLQLNLCIIIN